MSKLSGRNQQGAEGDRYGFQGQFAEADDEMGWNAFELRMWDGRIGRWMNTDPYKQFTSPYLAMGNIPTGAIDRDGRLIIFVAGQHGAEGGQYNYWGPNITMDMMDALGDHNSIYADGGLGGWKNTLWEGDPTKNNLNTLARASAGKEWAKNNLKANKGCS